MAIRSIGLVISENTQPPGLFNYSFVISSPGSTGEGERTGAYGERWRGSEPFVYHGMYCFSFSKEQAGFIVGVIEQIIAINRYYTNSETIKDFDNSSLLLFRYFPVSEFDYKIARVKVLGLVKLDRTDASLMEILEASAQEGYMPLDGINPEIFSRLDRSAHPVKPGDRVFHLKGEYLKNFLGLDSKGLHIGEIRHENIRVSLNIDKLFRKHLAILAQSGAGKSYLISVLLEELLKRSLKEPTPAIILIDVHGEYRYLSDRPSPAQYERLKNKGFADFCELYRKVEYYHGSFLQIATQDLNEYDFIQFVPELSSVQARELRRAIQSCKKKFSEKQNEPFGGDSEADGAELSNKRGYDLDDLIEELENDAYIASNTKRALSGWLYDLKKFHLFGKSGTISIKTMAKVGKLSIIDLSPLVSNRKKQILLYYITKKLFQMRRNDEIPPFILILEEAHNFIPEQGDRGAFAKSILEQIAREGRKFYAQLVLVSQRPVRLSTTVLSQCNTQIIMRITNPYDLDHIKATSESLTKNSLNIISTLPTGNALVMGAVLNFPLFVKVRNRIIANEEDNKDLTNVCRKFINNRAYSGEKNISTDSVPGFKEMTDDSGEDAQISGTDHVLNRSEIIAVEFINEINLGERIKKPEPGSEIVDKNTSLFKLESWMK